jgi:hypothetical protein
MVVWTAGMPWQIACVVQLFSDSRLQHMAVRRSLPNEQTQAHFLTSAGCIGLVTHLLHDRALSVLSSSVSSIWKNA